jgi:hypothetical protein
MMPTWLLNPTVLRYVGIAGAALMLFLGAYIKGRHDVQVKFDGFKAEVAAAAKAQEDHNKQIQSERDLFNKGVVDGYKAKLAAANAYINGLRYDSSTGKLSTPSDSTTGSNGGTANLIPPTPVLAADCARTTVQLMQLQQWVQGQGDIK